MLINVECLVCTVSIKLHVMFGRHGSVLTDRCRRVSLATCRLPTRAVLHESVGYNLQEERRREGGEEGEASKAGRSKLR